MKKIKEFATCVHTLLHLKTCSFWHLNKNISKQNFLLFLKLRYTVLDRVPFEFMYLKNGVPSLFRRK